MRFTPTGLLLAAPLLAAQDYPDLPLGPPAPLPTARAAEESMAAGDQAWVRSLRAPEGDRAGLRRTAFDAWQRALATTEAGAAIALELPAVEDSPFYLEAAWGPSRAAEGVQDGVLRRLSTLPKADVRTWIERFGAPARAALANAMATAPDQAAARLGAVERRFPLTRAAVTAGLGCLDLALEEGRLEIAASWATKVTRQLELIRSGPGADWLDAADASLGARQDALEGALARVYRGSDHTRARTTAPYGSAPAAAVPELQPMDSARIAGIERSASDPFGRGLPSGLAVLNDGSLIVQGAPGLMLAETITDEGALKYARGRTGETLGVGRVFPRATASAGGWSSLPATDGVHVAIVAGRAERPRPFLDLEIPPTGNVLGLVVRGTDARPIRPLWVLRDGRVLRDPAPSSGPIVPDQLAPHGSSVAAEGWDLGLGWEWQPGPVVAGGVIYALARGLGDAGDESADHAGEVRLFALDLDTAAVLWSREVTSELGRSDDRGRGEAAAFAVTTMPLAIHRPSGTLFVGTNAGLACAFGAAEGRLLWSVRTQRTGNTKDGWPGSQSPLVVQPGQIDASSRVWMTPLGSEFAYALVAGPWPLGAESPLAEAPRPRRGAVSIAAAHPPSPGESGSTLVLLGQDGRHDAILLDTPGKSRISSTYLAPSERFGGHAAETDFGLVLAGSRELLSLDRGAGYAIGGAGSLGSRGAGRGGDVATFGDRIFVVGRDTLWVYRAVR